MPAQHTQAQSEQVGASREQTAPRQVLLGLWGTLLMLTLLSADEQRERVARDAWLGSQPWAVAIASGAARTAAALGLSRLYAALQDAGSGLIPEPPRLDAGMRASLHELAGGSEDQGATPSGALVG